MSWDVPGGSVVTNPPACAASSIPGLGTDFLNPGIEPAPPAWQEGSLPLNHQGSPMFVIAASMICPD